MDYPLAFRDMEYSGFCGLVDAGGCWWMLVGSSGKWIILLPLGMWNMVDSGVWSTLVESSEKRITLLPLKEWNKVTSTVC